MNTLKLSSDSTDLLGTPEDIQKSGVAGHNAKAEGRDNILEISKDARGLMERSSITSARWRGVGGLTEIADAAYAIRGYGGSQVKITDVILEQIF